MWKIEDLKMEDFYKDYVKISYDIKFVFGKKSTDVDQ